MPNNLINTKIKKIKVLFLDADGVFFDGQENLAKINEGKVVFKSRSHQDGQGLSFLRAIKIKIVFVSGEGEPLNSVIDKLNKLPSVVNGKWQPIEVFTDQKIKGSKLETLKKWLKENNVSPAECGYMGDDVNDFEAMSFIKSHDGLTIAPANLTRKIAPLADIITKASGGKGAIRELAEIILDVREVNEITLTFA